MTASQKAPAAGADLSAFPSATVPAGERMYRAHGAARGAWYFDNSDAGRFNLRGACGTCCTAMSIDTAVREKVRGQASRTGVVSRALADSFVVSCVATPDPRRCAAVSCVDAAKHGVVRELVTMADYSITQAWAGAFADAGFDGVFYGSAFTTGDASAYALFGEAGVPRATDGYTETQHMTGADACAAVGFRVERPSSRGLTVLS